MKCNNLGPKLLLNNIQYKQQDEEDIPEEPTTREIKQKNVKYKHIPTLRYDVKGRQIIKGTGYGIAFDNFVTVCVYDPQDDVLTIKDTLSELTNAQELGKVNRKKGQHQKNAHSDGDIILQSILKS